MQILPFRFTTHLDIITFLPRSDEAEGHCSCTIEYFTENISLSWWKCHWPDLKSAGLFPNNLFLNEVTLTLTLWPINSGVLTSLLLPHLTSSLTDSLPSLNLLCHSKTDAQFMQDGLKTVWSIPYVSVAFFPSLKQNFIAYFSSKVFTHPDCIFEIHQLWQSVFSRVYSNSCCMISGSNELLQQQ